MGNELFSKSDDLHPGDFELGSVESRAAARAAMSDPGRPPSFIVQFVDPGPGWPCESRTASVNGKTLTIERGESQEDFGVRISLELPALGGGMAMMWADLKESVSPAEDSTGATRGAGRAPKIST